MIHTLTQGGFPKRRLTRLDLCGLRGPRCVFYGIEGGIDELYDLNSYIPLPSYHNERYRTYHEYYVHG